jgi:hypothetical protein
MGWRGLNSSSSGNRQVVGCSESSNEIWVPYNEGTLLTSWEAINFLRRERIFRARGFVPNKYS